MGKVVVVNGISLDGVMQAPARADEDTRDGFKFGGWGIPYTDPVMAQKMAERMAGAHLRERYYSAVEHTKISTPFGPNERMAIPTRSI